MVFIAQAFGGWLIGQVADAGRYRQRNVVERCVNRLKQWRGIATRFDKRAANYRAAVVIVSLILWLT